LPKIRISIAPHGQPLDGPERQSRDRPALGIEGAARQQCRRSREGTNWVRGDYGRNGLPDGGYKGPGRGDCELVLVGRKPRKSEAKTQKTNCSRAEQIGNEQQGAARGGRCQALPREPRFEKKPFPVQELPGAIAVRRFSISGETILEIGRATIQRTQTAARFN